MPRCLLCSKSSKSAFGNRLTEPQCTSPSRQAVWSNKGHGRSEGGRTSDVDNNPPKDAGRPSSPLFHLCSCEVDMIPNTK